MDCLGFTGDDGAIYEGSQNVGYRSVPRPFLTPIAFPEYPPEPHLGPINGFARSVFREDTFDPVTRIRRGRVFTFSGGRQPQEWHVQDPDRKDLETVNWRYDQAQLLHAAYIYHGDSLTEIRRNFSRQPNLTAILGKEPFLSIWTALMIEDAVSGPPVLTLRLQRSLSGLPEIDYTKFDHDFGQRLRDAMDALENSNHRQGAVDVVDRCRAVLQLLFAHRSQNFRDDLGELLKRVRTENPPPNLACWAADTVAKFHSRGKPNEQHKFGTRSVDEDDAQLAIGCVGLVIKEFSLSRPS